MIRTTDTTIGGLLAMTWKPIVLHFRRRFLLAERKAEFMNARYFEWQRDNGQRGFSDSQKRIMQINYQLQELERQS